MTSLYKDGLEIYQKTKKELMRLYYILLFGFVVAVTLLAVFAKAETYIYNLIANIILSVGFAYFSIFFLGIKLKLTQKHIDLAKMFQVTKPEISQCLVVKQPENIVTLNGLEYNELQIKWQGKDKYETRRVFYQGEKLECFNTNESLMLELRANIIVAYEVINNG